MDKEAQNVEIKENALAELEAEIIYFCLHYSVEYADQFRLTFFYKVSQILQNPYLHPECRFVPTKTQMYRNIIWGNYLIIYKIKRTTIEVLSLFHTKQKPSKIKLVRKIK